MQLVGEFVFQLLTAFGLDGDLLNRYGYRMLQGLGVTLQLTFISMLAGFILSFPVAIARVEGNFVLRGLALAYTTFFRGTPLLAQTFLVYYGAGEFRTELESIGLWWLFREAYWCALLTFTLNTCAYQSEILRGGIESVPRGQREAAQAVGLHAFGTYRHVIIPQALRLGLRPFGNELVLMLKASSIASVITVYELMGTTRLAFSRSYDFQVYLWAAALYLIMVELIRHVWAFLEERMSRHLVVSR
jgi:polar amino acid transport system permease protein